MNETRTSVNFEGGIGETVRLDAINVHAQRCRGTLGVPGTHTNAIVYKLECTLCGFVYGANSGDVHERKCPNCQGGKAGIRFWLIAKRVPSGETGVNGNSRESRVELVASESGADWFERTSGSMEDVPDSNYQEFLECARKARQEMNRQPDDAGVL